MVTGCVTRNSAMVGKELRAEYLVDSSTYVEEFVSKAVPWVSRVYRICMLRAVICIPEGAA